eukprot:1161832-Pelagomonas_calceolata.AAC.13
MPRTKRDGTIDRGVACKSSGLHDLRDSCPTNPSSPFLHICSWTCTGVAPVAIERCVRKTG